jgi:hypothetical protein
LVEVGDCVCLVADKVVQAVCGVGVDETVSNPLSSPDRLVDGGNQLNSGLNTILAGFTGVQAVDVFLTRIAENVKVFVTSEGNQFTRFGPVNLEQLA